MFMTKEALDLFKYLRKKNTKIKDWEKDSYVMININLYP